MKIHVALPIDYPIDSFKEAFVKGGLEVKISNNVKETLKMIPENLPEAILIDINLPEEGAFEVLSKLRESEETKNIPVIIYSKTGSEDHREKAMDYEVADFVTGYGNSPKDIAAKLKKVTGMQKAYTFDISCDKEVGKEIAEDLNYKGTVCPSCEKDLALYLLRDLSVGENVFQVSLVCPHCFSKPPKKK